MKWRSFNGNAAVRSAARQEPSPVEQVLKSVLKRAGLDEDINRYKFVLHWREIVGDEIASRTRPESLRNGLLRVCVADSAWAQELSFHKQVILKRLQKYVSDDGGAEDIMFYVGDPRLWQGKR